MTEDSAKAAVTAPSAQAQSVPCVVCREDIRPGAQVCTHCKNAQNWTRYVIMWSGFAAAIVGLASLISATYSLARLVPLPADIKAVALRCDADAVKLAFINTGDKPGRVSTVTLTIENGSRTAQPVNLIPIDIEGHEEKLVVEPNKTSVITYAFMPSGARAPFTVPSSTSGECRYEMSIGTAGFNSKERKPFRLDCACPGT